MILILIFALFLRLYFFVGLNWSDDVGYVNDAYRVLKNEYIFAKYPPSLRTMMIYPLAFIFFIFGISNYTATLYPLLTSIGGIVIIFFLGKTIFDYRTGLIAALLLSFFPLDVIYATWIMPDVPIAFLMGVSVYFFLKANKKSNIYYLISGLVLGIAYLVKETAIILFLFYIPVILYKFVKKKKIDLRFSYILFGFLIIFVLESLFLFVKTGDFLFRYHTSSWYFGTEDAPQKHGLNVDLKYYPLGLFNLNPNLTFNQNKYLVNYGLFYYFVILAMFFLIFKREKKSYIVIFWFLILFFYLEFGSSSITHYAPVHKLYRHLTVITIPAVLSLSYFLSINFNSKKLFVNLSSILIIFFLFASSIFYIYYQDVYLDAASYDMRELYTYFKSFDNFKNKIYTDGGTVGHLKLYSSFLWDNILIPIGEYTNCTDIKNSYVIINATRGWIEYEPMISSFPECFKKLPKNWNFIKEISGPEIDVYSRYNPKIYYVP